MNSLLKHKYVATIQIYILYLLQSRFEAEITKYKLPILFPKTSSQSFWKHRLLLSIEVIANEYIGAGVQRKQPVTEVLFDTRHLLSLPVALGKIQTLI